MLKIFNCLLLIGFVVASTQLEAKTIKLAPNESKMLANNAPFTLNATCNVHAVHPIHSKIRIVVLKNKGTINGKNLSSGQGQQLWVNETSQAQQGMQSHEKNKFRAKRVIRYNRLSQTGCISINYFGKSVQLNLPCNVICRSKNT